MKMIVMRSLRMRSESIKEPDRGRRRAGNRLGHCKKENISLIFISSIREGKEEPSLSRGERGAGAR